MRLKEASLHNGLAHLRVQIMAFHTIPTLLLHAGNTQALITFYQLALNFSINSSISFPGYVFPQTPRQLQSPREKK